MKISIIIPIYNVEKYLKTCLDSIFTKNSEETLKRVEIIGIDDVSPDNSAKIFKEYINNFPEYNISLITHQHNKGLGGARNTGVNVSTGDYILFVDSDDWLSNGALDYLLKELYLLPEDTILSFGFEAKKEGAVVWNYIPKKKESIQSEEALRLFSLGTILPSAWNKVYPSKLFKEIKFKEQLYYEDLEFTPRAISLTANFYIDSKVIYNYRLDGSSITRQKTKKKHIDDLFTVILSLKKNIKDSQIFSTIFCDRWNYLLKTWHLSNNLKTYALKKMLSILKDSDLTFNHEKSKNLSIFLENQYHTSKYDIQFKKIKKRILEIINTNNEYGNLQHSINVFFDKIYIVNLENNKEDKYTISKQLIDKNIDFQIWEATNGYSNENRKLYEEYLNRGIGKFNFFHEYKDLEKYRGAKFIESPGAYGYIQTYISIIKNAKNNKYKSILILEDDTIFVDDFDEKLEIFLKKVKSDWKIIQLGASEYNWGNVNTKEALKEGYYSPKAIETCGSFAMAINNSIYDELIKVQSYFDGPFDHIPIASLYTKYQKQCYVCFPNIIVPNVTTSSIRNGRDQFTHGEKMKWNLNKYPFPAKKMSISIIITSRDNLKYIKIEDNTLNKVFDLRWFINTSVGIRPIHQNDYIKNPKLELNHTYTKNNNIELDTDFEFIIPAETTLTEELVYNKIDSLLNTNISYNLNYTSEDIIDVSKKTPAIKSTKDLVSVIVPTYKRNKNLKHTLNSLINQNHHSVEILVVDDNGSHYSEYVKNVVNSCKGKHPVKYIGHEKNLNGAAARNTGILHAKGEYICFLDDDDIYLQGKIKKSIDVIKKTNNEKIGGVYCGFLGWNSKINNLERYKKGDLTFELLSLNFTSHYLNTNTAFYKKSALTKINGFDESFQRHQDLELNIRFFEYFEMEVVKEILVELNPIPSESNNKVYNEEMFQLKEKFLTRFKPIIDKFPENEKKIIYKKNWEEALRFFENKSHFINYCKSKYELGYLTILQEILFSKEQKAILPKNKKEEIADNTFLKNHIIFLEKKIEKLEEENINNPEIDNNELVYRISDKQNQLDWYHRTYDHLPKWYLKIGGIFRRIKIKKN